jgi:hypothetical protein
VVSGVLWHLVEEAEKQLRVEYYRPNLGVVLPSPGTMFFAGVLDAARTPGIDERLDHGLAPGEAGDVGP